MSIDYAALKTELQTDPNSYGYAQYITSGQDSVLADMLNLARAAIQLPRPNVPPSELLEAISVDDFIASANQTILHGSWLESLLQFQSIRILKENGSDTRVMTNIMKILKNGTASETRVRTLAVRNGSRAEQLFGPGVSITHMDVAQALRG
jgi:hypothetical protein